MVISLERKLMVVSTRPGTDIADEALRKALAESGYDVRKDRAHERSLASIRELVKGER